jgi:hypothetical protein
MFPILLDGKNYTEMPLLTILINVSKTEVREINLDYSLVSFIELSFPYSVSQSGYNQL